MRILQLANGYFGNKLYAHLFSSLERVGVENRIYVPLAKNSSAPDPDSDNIIVSKCFSQLDRFLFFSKQKKMLDDIEKNIQLPSIDAIHAHTVFSGGYTAYQLNKKYGIPYIVAVRNTDVNIFFKYMVHLRSTGVEILRHAEKVVFLSPAYQRRVLERLIPEKDREAIRAKSLVIPNGISKLFLEHPAEPKALRGDTLRLIYVGEVSANKNPELTLRAISLLRDGGQAAKLTVVGAIKEKKYQKIMTQAEFVEYHEQCPPEEVLGYLKEADIFVMPSHTETFGIVYAEAMSQGLPVLYTRGQGFDGYFPDGTAGYAVPDTDPRELARKIQQAAACYGELSSNCVRLAKRFNWDSIADQYQQIYREIT